MASAGSKRAPATTKPRGAGRRRVSATALVAIDWGTTSARAYRLDGEGAVQARQGVPLGVKHVRDGRFEPALAKLLGDWIDDPAPRIACGMIGSRQGWVEAPYVDCPASLAALADRVVRAPHDLLTIVPGVATRDAAGIPDVMRGEETQLLGAIGTDERGVLAVLPGTHSKWARVEHGRVVDFTTFMTGELYAVLIDHSMLGRIAGHEPGRLSREAFSQGVARGLDEGELAHDVFGARTLTLTGARHRVGARRRLAVGPVDRTRGARGVRVGGARGHRADCRAHHRHRCAHRTLRACADRCRRARRAGARRCGSPRSVAHRGARRHHRRARRRVNES